MRPFFTDWMHFSILEKGIFSPPPRINSASEKNSSVNPVEGNSSSNVRSKCLSRFYRDENQTTFKSRLTGERRRREKKAFNPLSSSPSLPPSNPCPSFFSMVWLLGWDQIVFFFSYPMYCSECDFSLFFGPTPNFIVGAKNSEFGCVYACKL